jgi:hypothetical protein
MPKPDQATDVLQATMQRFGLRASSVQGMLSIVSGVLVLLWCSITGGAVCVLNASGPC